MKYIFLLFFALVIAATAKAQSPWYFGTGEAVNLTNGTAYKNGVKTIAGSLNPSSTAVAAPSGSMYYSTSGTIYVKQDSGLTTNWLPLGIATTGSLTTINGQSGPNVNIAVGTSGSDYAVSAASNTITLNLPTASAIARGALSSGDWSLFNSKEPAITSGTTSQFWRGDKTFVALTKSDVGLSNVDNTSDASKPISTATQAALNLKEDAIAAGTTSQYWRGDKSWQTLDKSAVGLGNLDNTSDANKPVSTATQTALNLKVDGAASSVDSEVMLYSGTTGKVSKRATGTGYAKLTSGVLSTSSTVAASDLTGQVALANGGTNKSLTPVNGGVVYTDADSQEVTAAGTSGQILKSNGAAAPTWINKSISAKAENTASVTLEEIRVPNNQLSLVGNNNERLIETGNKNILANPSFEDFAGLTPGTDWTLASGSYALGSSPLHGKSELVVTLSAEPLLLSQFSTLYAGQYADGVQGLALVFFKNPITSTPIYVCSGKAGSTTYSSTSCVQTNSDGKWGLYKVPFILGGTSNGIFITSNGVNVTGSVRVDDAFVGAGDLKQDVQIENVQTQIIGQTASFGAATVTGVATTTSGSGLFSYASGTGIYTVLKDAKFSINATLKALNTSPIQAQIFVGSTEYASGSSGSGGAGFSGHATLNRKLTAGTTFYVANATNTTNAQEITVTAVESQPSSVYSTQNGDYGPTVYTPTLSSTTGVSGNVALHSRKGEMLRVSGYVSWSGAGGGANFTVSLPSGLTINTAKIPSTTVLANRLGSGRWFDSGSTTHPENVEYASSTSINFRADDSTGAIPQGTGFAAGDFVAYYFEVPITEWTTSNVIIGSFADLNYIGSRADVTTFSQTFNATGSTVVYQTERYDYGANFNPATGIYTATVAGLYRASWCNHFASAAYVVGNRAFSILTSVTPYGTIQDYGQTWTSPAAASFEASTCGSIENYLAVGGTMTLSLINERGATALVSGRANYLTITRLPGQVP